MQKVNRIEVLDLLRFLAAISVVYYHYLYRGWRTDGLSDVNFDFYDGFLKYGYLGVQVFFVISGFVIYLSIKKRDIKGFVVSRVSRLYPTFWLCLTVTLFFVYFLDDGRFEVGLVNSLFNYLMFSKIFGIPFVDGAYWTLIYELAFYFWVFVTLLMSKDWLIEVLCLFSCISLIFIFFGIEEKYMVFWCGSFVGYFLVGAVFYRFFSGDYKVVHLFSLFVGMALCFVQAYLQVEKKNQIPGVELNYTIVLLVLLVLFGFFFFISRGYLSFLNCKWFWHLGVITYPCYLLHQNVGYIVINAYGSNMSQGLLLVAISLPLLVVSYLIGRFYEPFAIRSSKRFLGKFL